MYRILLSLIPSAILFLLLSKMDKVNYEPKNKVNEKRKNHYEINLPMEEPKTRYTAEQMREIRIGLEAGVDVSNYDVNYPRESEIWD